MATLNEYIPGASIKALICADSGSGKTGSLASLVKAGYNLRILDYDNGVGILAGVLKREPNAAELLSRVDAVPLSDPMDKNKPKAAVAWTKTNELLDGKLDWKPYGPIETWTSSDILVVDSLTLCSRAIFNHTMALAGRLGAKPGQKQGGVEIQHWGQAMDEQEAFLATLYDDSIKCHVLVLSHILIFETDDGTRGYPAALGSKLPAKVPRYFNNLWTYKLLGSGPGLKREIHTRGNSLIAGKAESLDLPPTLPIETGLATIFETIGKRT